MSTTDSPAVARRRVRLALRRAREAKHLTQGQIAEAMEWSLSKVMRIEKGDVSISASDLRVLLDFLDVRDPDAVQQLITDARAARLERWSPDHSSRENLTPALSSLLQFEAEARAIRYYHPVVVPGLLQTEEYARAVMANYDELDEETIQARVEFRRRRREAVLYREDPPQYLAIIDQSTLLREVGGPAVTGRQLQEMLHIMRETAILVRIIPFARGVPIALLGPFAVLDLADEQNAVLYREGYMTDDIVHTPREISRHREIFEKLWPLALDDAESTSLIQECADLMLAGGGHRPPGTG
ncbi:MAG TPA: helix-turn-helix transcriptional regulator [Rugosimonospora sp.]|nr:helix-turn-helix transcriptional regulator [Rugosimonospora sp.]